MVEHKTVLILGAGASAHCGYPLGRQLVSNICFEESHLSKLELPWTADYVRAFVQRLSRSDPRSIDAHLGALKEYSELGKFLIAEQLKKREKLKMLFPPNDAGWYRDLFDAIVDRERPNFRDCNVSIITFNYDRSLEAYFHARLAGQFGLSERDAGEVLTHFPIVHVHGSLGSVVDVPYDNRATIQELAEIARGIRVIHDIEDIEGDFCSEEFRSAHNLLTQSERIFFLGFGFHRENVKRLRFFNEDTVSERVVRATVQGVGSVALKAMISDLSEFGFTRETFHAAECNQFFSFVHSL